MKNLFIFNHQPYFSDEIKGTMDILVNWMIECDKVVTF
jgi:hypothetical protein